MSNRAATARPIDADAETANELLVTVLESIPDPAALCAADGLVLHANRRFRLCFGRARPSQAATSLSDEWFVHPRRDLPRFTELLHRAAQPGLCLEPINVSLHAEDDSEISAEIHARGVLQGQSEQTSIVVVFRDVTHEQALARQVEAHESRHEEWLQASTEMVFCLDTKGQFLFVNKRWQERLGFCSKEVVGTSGLALVCPESHKEVRAAAARLNQGQTVENLQFRSKTKDGRTVDVLANLRPIRDASGKVVQILGAGRDITELKRAQEELEESQERLRTIFEYAPDAYYLCDLKGRFVDGNKAAERIIGYERDELIGKSFLKLNILARAQIPKAAAALAKNALRKPTGPDEFVLTRKDGTEVTVEVSTYPVKMQGQVLVLGIARDVTERKRVQEELRDSEAKYRDLHDSSRDGCTATDLNGTIIECNPAFQEMLGYTKEELRRLRYEDITPRRWHRTEARIVSEQVLARGYSDLYEKEYRRKDGTVFPIELRVYLKRDKDGNATGMWAIVRDITERKRVEEDLRESEERFKTIFDQAHEGIAYLSLTGRILEANAQAMEFFGGPRDAIIGKHFTELGVLALADIPRLLVHFKQLVSGNLKPAALWIKNKQGKDIYLECSASLVRRNTRPVGLVVMARDATERKRAEDALRESEDRYRSVFNSAGDALCILDSDGTILEVNPEMCRMHGYRSDELIGSSAARLVHPDHAGQFETFRRRLSRAETFHTESRGLHKDGRAISVEVTGTPFVLNGRKCILAILRDITERKQAEETLEKLNRDLQNAVTELERSNEELRDFAHVTAHDLKAPLRGITMLADWISQDCADMLDESQQENLHLLQNRADKMTRLIEGILRYSEIGHGDDQIDMVDTHALAEEIIEQVAPSEHVEIRIENTLPVVPCEKTRLTQVLQNLISNAIKYVDKPQGKVRIAAREEADGWTFRVADNGPGIETQHFERIFKMFQTLSSSDHGESTGLGLAVVKKIVEMHGGRVWLESEIGRGSTFYFTLPKQTRRPVDC